MPSIRNKPPEKTEEVTLTRSCVANGERQAAGATILVSPQTANLLVGQNLAVPGKAAKKKAAKAKPVVEAER